MLVDDDGIVVKAHAIAYATAQRFAAPVPAPRHSDVLDATRRGVACPQLPSRLDFVNGPIADSLAKSENCQVLSVTAPHDAQGLPVMVWFHGGAYMSGSGEAPKYDPDALVTEGRVVVVTVSYRLGIFGYLNFAGERPTWGCAIRFWRCGGPGSTSRPSVATPRASRSSVNPQAEIRCCR